MDPKQPPTEPLNLRRNPRRMVNNIQSYTADWVRKTSKDILHVPNKSKAAGQGSRRRKIQRVDAPAIIPEGPALRVAALVPLVPAYQPPVGAAYGPPLDQAGPAYQPPVGPAYGPPLGKAGPGYQPLIDLTVPAYQPPLDQAGPSYQPPFHQAGPALPNDNDYQRLLDLQNANLVENTDEIICPICSSMVVARAGVVLKDCLHSFCRPCLHRTIVLSEAVEVQCPFKTDAYSCESSLQDREVKSILSPDDYQQFLRRSVFQARCLATDAFYCLTPDCEGWCIYENRRAGKFTCELCGQTNCIPCSVIHKEGEQCESMLLQQQTNLSHLISNAVPEAKPATVVHADNPAEMQPICANISPVMQPVIVSTANIPSELASDYHSLLEVTDMGLVTNPQEFQCPVCFDDVGVGKGVTLKDCLHNYCRECLTGTIKHSETFLVKCPFVCEEYTCESYIQEREIKSLLPPADYDRHLELSMALAERQSQNSFHCKTPNCRNWCLVEDEVNQFYCQVCEKINCLSCAAIHEGQNCKQYQDLAALESATSGDQKKTNDYIKAQIKKNQAMFCPICHVVVMKREGCDWLLCSMCRTEICWATKGLRWGPAGKGDTSGGCKCSLGKRCHKSCKGCH